MAGEGFVEDEAEGVDVDGEEVGWDSRFCMEDFGGCVFVCASVFAGREEVPRRRR